MAEIKEINLFLNFKSDTPNEIIEKVKTLFKQQDSFLTNGYRHPCGKPVLDFYLDEDRQKDYHKADGTYYLRYCNCLKDYDDNFEAWLASIAPYIVQINGHHIGNIYYDCKQSYHLIKLVDGKIVYLLMREDL